MNHSESPKPVELYDEAVRVSEGGDLKKASKAYGQVVKKFGDSTDTYTQKIVAMSLVNKSGVLQDLERYDNAIETCDEVIARFGQSDFGVLKQQVVMAFSQKSRSYGMGKGEYEKANAVYEECLSKFGRDEAEELSLPLADMLCSQGSVLGGLERY